MAQEPLLDNRVPPAQPFPRRAEEPDDIKAVDLLLIVVRRKWLFWGVLGGLFSLTLLAWYVSPGLYRYRTTVELGGTVAEEQMQPLEPAQSALAKLESTWIPTFVEDASDLDAMPTKFEVSIPKGTHLLILESLGTAGSAQRHLEAHESILQPLLEDHKAIEDILHQRLTTELEIERLALEAIKDEAAVLKTRHRLLEEEAAILAEEARKLRRDIEESRQQWLTSVNEVEEDTRAVILLMLETEMSKNRARLEVLNRRLRIGLPGERAELEQSQEEIRRSEQRQVAVITEVEGRLRTFRGSRLVGRAVRSETPGGLGGLELPAAVILAAIVGLVAALAAVILARLRAELRSRLATTRA